MLRKVSLGLLFITASLSTTTYSIESNLIQSQSITVDYDLPTNQPQLFTNYMFWTVEANCKIMAEDESNTLYIVALAKKGKINDLPLLAGQSLYVTVHPNENLRISADSGAKVEITNLGEHLIKTSCST